MTLTMDCSPGCRNNGTKPTLGGQPDETFDLRTARLKLALVFTQISYIFYKTVSEVAKMSLTSAPRFCLFSQFRKPLFFLLVSDIVSLSQCGPSTS